MLKSKYLHHPEVAGFVNWLSEDCKTRPFTLNILRSPYVDAAVRVEVKGIEELLEKYNWRSSWTHPITKTIIRSSDWATTQTTIGQLADGVRDAIQAKDEDLCLEWCLCILKWGGVRGAKIFLENLHREQQLVNYLSSTQPLLQLDTDSDDAAIHTINIKRFDAGLTKIHAFIDTTGSPIYDSRVGAAISMLAAIYTEDVKHEHSTNLLKFPTGDARGKQYRNPRDMDYGPAPKFYTSAVTRDNWARAQLRLGWILQAVIENNKNLFDQFGTQVERIQAFQGALFMAGYDLRCFNSGDKSNATTPPGIPSDDTETNQPFEQFGKVVPSSFSMKRVAELLNGYLAAYADDHQPFNRQNFISWQTQLGGVAQNSTAASNCYPLKNLEFDMYNRTAEEIEMFCNGGYQSLLDLVDRITPSWNEREYDCIHSVYLVGKLHAKFNARQERNQCLIDRGFAGTELSADVIFGVGRSVGRHFGLISPDNAPTDQFYEYFSAPEWDELFD